MRWENDPTRGLAKSFRPRGMEVDRSDRAPYPPIPLAYEFCSAPINRIFLSMTEHASFQQAACLQLHQLGGSKVIDRKNEVELHGDKRSEAKHKNIRQSWTRSQSRLLLILLFSTSASE